MTIRSSGYPGRPGRRGFGARTHGGLGPDASTILLVLAMSANFFVARIVRSDASARAPSVAEAGLYALESVHDFGRVNGGDLLSHEFALTNDGPRAIRITEVKASCSCVVVGEWPQQLAPSGNGSIPLVFHTVNYRGPVTETLTVTTDDPGHPSLRLEIKADVWRPVEIIPPAALFEIDPGSPAQSAATVRILNQTEPPLHLGSPEPSHRSLVAELATNSPGREYQVAIRLVEPFPAGNLFGNVRLKTSSPEMPLLEIPVYATQPAAIAITPREVLLPAGQLTNQFEATINIRSRGTNVFRVSDPAIGLPGVQVALAETQTGRTFLVRLTFPAGFELPAGTRHELTLRSNHPQHPQVRIPVTQAAPVAVGPR